jgi:crotonobetainyl-CoA:carnitine CoA-transferase CaiB-like acyl-CoA transferase
MKSVGPLAGLRVIELAHIMAGPVCGLMLADMGADVIKVERVPGGDDSRRMLPPDIDGEAAAFMMLNRNKRGIAIDLKTAGGKEVLLKLVETADVLVENYRHDTLGKLGLGYERLAALNPGLIYCEISGFGRTGPYAERGGFDLIAQGMSGLMSVTGEGPGRPPIKVGAPVTDITAGIIGALGVLAAYVNRLKTGKGQRVDTSLFEAGIVHTYWQSAICLATGVAPGPMGSAHPLNAPYQAFPTADGWITVGAANDRNWRRTLDVLARPDLAEEARFVDNAARMKNLAALTDVLNPIFQEQCSIHWLERLEAVGVPAGPVLDVAAMQADPQTLARSMLVDVDHSRVGPVKTIGLPIKFSATPGGVRSGAPTFGEHGRSILVEYGFDPAAIEQLVRDGEVHLPDSSAAVQR